LRCKNVIYDRPSIGKQESSSGVRFSEVISNSPTIVFLCRARQSFIVQSIEQDMKILVTGAAGMIGRKFCEALAKRGSIGNKSITRLTMADAITPTAPTGAPFEVNALSADITDSRAAESFIADRPEMIYHLAAVVSGEAEADLEKGYRVNLSGTQQLFEAIRQAGYRPRVIFASSIAVYGTPFPDPIPEDYALRPLTSYGTQKAIGELLLGDLSRRGFFDGIGIRFPTICVRPGKPNKAASGFFSSIIREPINGQKAVLPVGEDVRHWFASPRAAANFLLHAGAMELEQLGSRRTLNMPGLSATVGEMISSLEKVAGGECTALIQRQPDSTIQKIVDGWPQRLDASRAEALGFRAESSFQEIIEAYIEDECDGKLPFPRRDRRS
jgi:nucleoside-diphosphate-sugar epimerase